MKRNKGRRFSDGLRALKAISAFMLMLVMVFSGFAPSFYAYAEEGSEAAEEQVQAEKTEAETAEPKEAKTEVKEEAKAAPEEAAPAASWDADASAAAEEQQAGGPDTELQSGEPDGAGADGEAADDAEADKKKEYPAQSFSGQTAELSVKADAAEGVFPEGTEMKVRSVSQTMVINAAQSLTDSSSEVVDAAAADITFHSGGKEIQPKGKVRVRLKARHALDGESFEAVTVDDSGRASVVSDATAQSGTFSTDHFTVYGIIGTDDKNKDAEKYADEDVRQHVRCTYVFYAGDPDADRALWQPAGTQTVRNGDKIKTPADPAGDSKHSFDGWFTENGHRKIENGSEVVLDPSVLSSEKTAGGQERDITVNVFAGFSRKYRVTLYTDHTKSTVYETHLLGKGETLDTLPAGGDTGFALDIEDGCDFSGWKIAGTEDKDVVSSVAIDNYDPGDIELVPVFTSVRIVRFVVDPEGISGISGTQVRDQHIPVGGKAEMPAWPVKGDIYKGYVFEGWFGKCELDEESGKHVFSDEYMFDKEVDDDIVLYAEWDPIEVSFSVEVYQEKQSAVGEYSLKYRSSASDAESFGFKGKPLTGIDADMIRRVVSYAEGKRGTERFHFSRTGQTDSSSDPYAIEVWESGRKAAEYDLKTAKWISGETDALIHGHGETVVRVYENRDTYNIHFLFSSGTNQKTYNNINGYTTVITDHQKHLPGGLAKEETLAGQSYVVRYKDNMYRTVYLNEVNPSNAGADASVIRSLMDAGWLFDASGCRAEKGQTVFNETNTGYNLNPDSDMTDGMDVVCLIRYNDSMIPHHFVSRRYRPDGVVEHEHETVIMYAKTPHGHSFDLFKETGGYRLVSISTGSKEYKEKNYNNGREVYVFEYDDEGNAKDMVLSHEPVPYSVSFDPQDGSDVITARNGAWEGHADVSSFFIGDSYEKTETDVSGAGRYKTGDTRVADGIKLRFDGWYDNAACEGEAHNFEGKTMPAKDLMFYGKWTPLDCTVVFHPDNGDEDSSQKVVIGGKAHRIANPEKEGAVFGGWYLDSGSFAKAYDFAAVLDEDMIRELESETEVEVIHLYAKWNSGNPYTVVYHANGGRFRGSSLRSASDMAAEDPVKYRGGSKAPVKFAAEKEGYVFAGWAVGTADSKTVAAGGQTFLADSANDLKDGTEDQRIHLYAVYTQSKNSAAVTYHSNYPAGTDLKVTLKVPAENGVFTVKGPDDADLGFGSKYRAPNGREYRFVCWMGGRDEMLFTNSDGNEYFFPEEKAAAGAADNVMFPGENDLYAVWELVEKTDGKEGTDPESPGDDGSGTAEEILVKTSSVTSSSSSAGRGIRTGDSAQLVLYIGMMAAALAAAAALLVIRR